MRLKRSICRFSGSQAPSQVLHLLSPLYLTSLAGSLVIVLSPSGRRKAGQVEGPLRSLQGGCECWCWLTFMSTLGREPLLNPLGGKWDLGSDRCLVKVTQEVGSREGADVRTL